jgi:hypothetical protein
VSGQAYVELEHVLGISATAYKDRVDFLRAAASEAMKRFGFVITSGGSGPSHEEAKRTQYFEIERIDAGPSLTILAREPVNSESEMDDAFARVLVKALTAQRSR